VRYPVRPGWALPSSDSAVPFRRSRRFSGRTSASTQEVAIVDPASTWRSAAACWSTASTTPLNRQNRHFHLGRCDAAVGTTRYDLCQGRRISAGTGSRLLPSSSHGCQNARLGTTSWFFIAREAFTNSSTNTANSMTPRRRKEPRVASKITQHSIHTSHCVRTPKAIVRRPEE
jgi:hypothetical protein